MDMNNKSAISSIYLLAMTLNDICTLHILYIGIYTNNNIYYIFDCWLTLHKHVFMYKVTFSFKETVPFLYWPCWNKSMRTPVFWASYVLCIFRRDWPAINLTIVRRFNFNVALPKPFQTLLHYAKSFVDVGPKKQSRIESNSGQAIFSWTSNEVWCVIGI